MKSIRKAYRGEKGFTLVELLVVIVILGILAAVAAVAIMRFMSAGNVSAANEELHQVKTAIAGAMFDGLTADLDGVAVGETVDWDGSAGVVVCGTVDAADYIDGTFKATYTINDDGTVDSAVVGGAGGSWGSKVTWDAATGGWAKA